MFIASGVIILNLSRRSLLSSRFPDLTAACRLRILLYRMVEINESERIKEKRIKRNEDNLRDLQDNIVGAKGARFFPWGADAWWQRTFLIIHPLMLPSHLCDSFSTSCEMLLWMKHKLESRFLGEISITSDTQMTPPLWQKAKKN